MSEPRWTPAQGEDGVTWTISPYWADVLDLISRGFSTEEAKRLAALKQQEAEETDE